MPTTTTKRPVGRPRRDTAGAASPVSTTATPAEREMLERLGGNVYRGLRVLIEREMESRAVK